MIWFIEPYIYTLTCYYSDEVIVREFQKSVIVLENKYPEKVILRPVMI